MQTTTDFDGVFRFTNATDEDFVFFWNNKEYTFKAGTCSPMIIANETLENIQEIRKKAAFKLATREFYKGKEYKRLDTLGKKSAGGLPPTFDEKVLEPWIEECLKPLPMAKAEVKEVKKLDMRFKASKSIGKNDGIGALNEAFKDSEVTELGVMSGK